MASIADALDRLDADALQDWMVGQRWFGGKARDVTVEVRHHVVLAGRPELAVVVVSARRHAGTHDLYQLVVGLERDELVIDVLADPERSRRLAVLLGAGARLTAGAEEVTFHWTGEVEPPSPQPEVRPLGADQSNSSVVIDDRLVLKVYRRLEPGGNPELELLRFLSDHGFANVAELAGWYELEGELLHATLGVAQRFVHGTDGWSLVLAELGARPDEVLTDLRELGEVIGRMHATLASDPSDPDFAPEEPGDDAVSLLVATIDEEIERAFLDLPDDPALAEIAGRSEQVRDRLSVIAQIGNGGRLIRQHGDLHLGQTIQSTDGWVVIDFEGEPARPLLERRRKHSPLRDVAGMLRSFAYAASASELLTGRPVPSGWEADARAAFLEGYHATADPSLLPSGASATERLLAVYELEKAVYELRYEVHNRPDWVGIPVAGILRLLDAPLS